MTTPVRPPIQTAAQYPSPEEVAAAMESEVNAALKSKEPEANAEPNKPPTPPAAPAPPTREELLKRAGISEDMAYGICSEILTKGYFEREYTIYGRIPVTLRTRDGFTRQRLIDLRDQYRVLDPQTQQEVYWRMALAGSLVKLNTEVFTHEPPTERDPAKLEAALDLRLRAVDRLPDSMLEQALYPLISRFDSGVYAAMADGAPQSF